MKDRNALAGALIFGLLLVLVGPVTSQPAPSQPGRLGADLTPMGAEAAGNAAGTIPAYAGGLPKTAMDPKVGYVDPFADEEPLYVITANNVEQYKTVLSAGHLALLKRDSRTFHMNVYPSHRTAAYPESVVAEVARSAGQAREDGYHIANVDTTTVPFPVPTDGLQVMWNHVYRWRGGSVERQIVWLPVAGNGKSFVVKMRQKVAFDQQGYMEKPRPDRLFASASFYISPPSALGMRGATWEPKDPAGGGRARWIFVPQTLDTRRLPSYDFDTFEPYMGGLRTSDENDGWNGSPERYDWKLVGKRELLIGYNAYRLAAKGLPYQAITLPRHVDPLLLRYELHRVWVVEATLHPGRHHRYYRRVFYVDEDTWQVAQEEVYNDKGVLFRFGDHQMMQFYDVQVPWYAATIHHDLGSGSYLVYGLSNLEPFQYRWGFKGRNADFLPSNLRALGLQ